MDAGHIRALMGKLNPTLTKTLTQATEMCIQRTHYEITVEHCLVGLLRQSKSDLTCCFGKLDISCEDAILEMERGLSALRTGNGAKPRFSAILLDALTHAWNFGNLERSEPKLRSIHLLVALLRDSNWLAGSPYQFLGRLSEEQLVLQLDELTLGSEESTLPEGSDVTSERQPTNVAQAFATFTKDLIAQAKEGAIDPVIGRDAEIHQVVDILSRRRKNNPILVGEPGVGKSAIVEGLALLIAEGKAPTVLENTEIRNLDLGLLKAGASMKGEFEERVKQVIDAVETSTTPVILFIDEAHTLIGAGGSAGSGDAANLLKPALARGTLRTIAATTWTEYKKYIEKDPALERRFQLVKIDEPDPAKAADMLRGLKEKYGDHHGVEILDSAIEAAANLADRYITGRQLPDKAIDLIDTACARVRLSLTGPPFEIVQMENQLHTLRNEIAAKQSEQRLTGDLKETLAELTERLASEEAEFDALNDRWQKEKALVEAVLEVEEAMDADDQENAEVTEEQAAELAQRRLQLVAELQELTGESPLLSFRVTPATIAQIVSQWTGIPVGKMVTDALTNLLELSNRLQQRVLGQGHAADCIARAVQVAKASIDNPESPIGAFLCVGPSGTGKTEMALALAEQLFGGERFVIQINMSEYQEKHTLSRLIGSPPGYVGYGEGGVLTEAVRQRPYSVVLLDEVEKGHPDVMNLFYQVFDKGHCADGEGRIIDFTNTVVMMTSNLGSPIIEDLCREEPLPQVEELLEAIRDELNRYFKPALLARMTVIPYFPISKSVMKRIVALKLRKIATRLADNHGITMGITAETVQMIADRCRLVEAGARNIDHILNGELLPEIATAILGYLLDEHMPTKLNIALDEDRFALNFED